VIGGAARLRPDRRREEAGMWRLFRALDEEWRLAVGGASARAAGRRWATDPVLGGFADVEGVVATLRACDDPERADRLLAALAARAATDDVALRAMLQALLPGLVNVAKRLGGGRVDDELEADVLAEAIHRIRTYPLQRRPRAIAANVQLDVFGRLARQRRRCAGEAAAAIAAPTLARPDPDPSLEVSELVLDAAAAGWLRPGDAELLLSIAVGRDTMRRRAERDGISYAAVNERWRRARNRLRRSVVPGDG
jgi:DNA-directed RNA polymerase specialized sigma24 family protein